MTTTTPTSIAPRTLTGAAAGVMPEPGDIVASPGSSGDADELMAKLADQQIDELLQEEEAGVTAAASDAKAVDPVAEEANAFGEQLVAAAATELHDELAQLKIAPTEAPTAAAEASPPVEAAADAELSAPTHVTMPEPSLGPAITPAVEAPSEMVTAAVAESPPAVDEASIQAAAPSFQPSQPAVTEAAAITEPAPTATEPAPAAFENAEFSDGEAVARELAADVAMLSSPLPGVIQHDAEVKAAQPDPLWRRMIDAALGAPVFVLDAINLPVRPLSDRGREIIGAVGIVTLVNAAGLLIYLGAFAARH